MVRVRVSGVASAARLRAGALWFCALGLTGFGATALHAQDDKVPTLHAYSNLVQVPTLVLDLDRKPIAPIAERRFFVSLDGGPRFQVTHVRPEGDDPISLAILLDLSQPYPKLMNWIDDAIAGMAPAALHASDHVSIYALDCELVRVGGYVPANSAALKRSVDLVLQSWKARGHDRRKGECRSSWNLWDSLKSVTVALGEQPGRRVVLAVTDGLDRGSKSTWNEVRVLAQQRAVAIFGVLQLGDTLPVFRNASSYDENLFNGVCELTGGMVMTATDKTLAAQLTQFVSLLRERYIVEFPRPMSTVGGYHNMDITVQKTDLFIRPSGIAVPVDDPAILNDPTTVKSDPANAPQLGNRKVVTPK
jgi:hypothetical protein